MQAPDRLRTFAYVTAEKAWLYRSIMRVFMEAKGRFQLHLRPEDVLAGLVDLQAPDEVDRAAVEAALGQLSSAEWGNLAAYADTAAVTTVEEFYRERSLYQVTAAGEAAERALAVYDAELVRPGELQASALGDIRDLLAELASLLEAGDVDAGKAFRTLETLRATFEQLTARAQSFMGSLQRTVDLQGVDLDAFVAYKDTLIDYLERFIGQLLVATDEIVAGLARVDRHDLDVLWRSAAERELADALNADDDDRAEAAERWRLRWEGLRGWFVRSGQEPAQAEVLRARARAAIPQLLAAVASINDRRLTRTDRVADLRTLARWFAEADSDEQAHRLWRAAFSLAPARHLRIDQATLDERDAEPVAASTSWAAAPPLRLSVRLRETGRTLRRGPTSRVIDRSESKALLARLVAQEAAQVAAARARLATGQATRLSALGDLDQLAFTLFLDLLGDALTRKVRASDRVVTRSADGAFELVLEPIAGGGTATITTSDGTLTGPDHWLTITDTLSADEPLEAAS